MAEDHRENEGENDHDDMEIRTAHGARNRQRQILSDWYQLRRPSGITSCDQLTNGQEKN